MKRFALLGITLCCSLMLHAQENSPKKTLNNEDIWAKNYFAAKSINGLLSMNDGKRYSSFYTDSKTKQNYILAYSYATGKVTDTIVSEADLQIKLPNEIVQIKLEDYYFSEDEKYIIITNATERIYRRSTKSLCYIYDRTTKTLQNLSDYGKQQFATVSPDGLNVAFARENNLFVRNIATRAETKITDDGAWEQIINGGTDWVNEEEFAFTRAFFWSPDSKKIAFYKFNESNVKRFSMTQYGELYPTSYQYKYPKAGEENATVSLHIYDLQNQQTIPVAIGNDSSQYIPRIKWTNQPNTLCVLRLNRHQDNLDYLLVNANTGKSTVILNEKSSTYIDINDDLYFLKNSNQFIISSEKNGFNHLYLYDLKGKLINQITKGNWDLTSFYGLNEKENTLYFQAAAVNAMQREIYAIGIDGKGMKKLSTSTGTNNATFSSNCAYYINFYSNANTPNFISLHDQTGLQMRVLETNEKLNNKLNEFALSKKEFLTIPTENNTLLNAWMIKPVDFDAKKKYPVFMFLYGGPGSQQVTDAWGSANYLWYQMLAAKGYIVVCVDNRGTGARGAEFKKCTFLQLGKLEIADQINAAKWLGAQSYVDASRIGIQGWSFGGYMSALAITKGADQFKMAIAVAPVTNWKYYDSIYTERYLHTPKENNAGYEENSPINFVDKIKGKFLIIHGTADDNVHFQNAADMVSAMIKANKKFESAYYPNKNHSIAGGNTRLHLYNLMTDFILTNL